MKRVVWIPADALYSRNAAIWTNPGWFWFWTFLYLRRRRQVGDVLWIRLDDAVLIRQLVLKTNRIRMSGARRRFRERRKEVPR